MMLRISIPKDTSRELLFLIILVICGMYAIAKHTDNIIPDTSLITSDNTID